MERGRDVLGVAAELAFERAVAVSRKLTAFRRNAATWELLLLLALADDGDEAGIYDMIDSVQSRALGHSALLKFIREQTDAGTLLVVPSQAKRSRRLTRLEPSLADELMTLLQRRNRLVALHHTPGKTTPA